MSFEAIAWAIKVSTIHINTTDKFVLLMVCNYADERGQAWPSQRRLSELTGLHARTVRKSLQRLEDAGLLERIPRIRDDGSTASNVYQIMMGAAPGGEGPGTGGGGSTTRGGRVHDPPMNLLVEPIKEINIDEVDQDEDQKQKIPRKGKTRFDASTVELPANVSPEIWGDWIAHRSETGHPLTPTSTRKQLQTLARLGADATASIEASITNGWRGLFPPKKQQARRPLHDVSGGDRQNRDHPDYRPVRGQDAVMNDRRNQLLDQMQQLTEELD